MPGRTYFFIVAIAERSKSLLVDRIEDLRDAFHAAHMAWPFTINAIVILPDHLHCLCLPARLGETYTMFAARGAYPRFQDMLEGEQALEVWYAF